MTGTHLSGLSGENPLDFLAALGVQIALNEVGSRSSIHWDCGINAHPIVSPEVELSVIAQKVLVVVQRWLDGPALDSNVHARLYLDYAEIRQYLNRSRNSATDEPLAQCLVAEGSMASSGKRAGKARTSTLDFTAGGKEILNIARAILSEVTEDQIVQGLRYSGRYVEGGKSLSWDLLSDRIYALRSEEAKSSNNLTRPGIEALAILGLSLHPCFGSRDSIMTQGCGRNDMAARVYTWPLWDRPASFEATKSLLAQASHIKPDDSGRVQWYRSWGIGKILQSHIRIRGQGHGSFGPPQVIWQYERNS